MVMNVSQDGGGLVAIYGGNMVMIVVSLMMSGGVVGVGMVFCSGYKGGIRMEVADDGGGQQKYNLEIFQRSGLSDCKPACSPMSPSQLLTIDDSPSLSDPTMYRQTVGALQYATLSCTDIAFAVNQVCRFMHAPTENHWSAVKCILSYLKGTTDLGLFIRHQSGTQLQAFTDALWRVSTSSPV
ncbi:hypothetical protein Lser_V15G41212 [Lactuca serriola]